MGAEGEAPGLTQRELLLEMRADLKTLSATVEGLAKDAALNVERRATAQRLSDTLAAEVTAQRLAINEMQRWQNRADGAMTLARWALGASLVSLVGVALQLIAALSRPVS